jgi:UDP-N-acetylmuramoyl-L-alanyl-D-glutamate--2,6-diaminopimelate ligase
MEGYFRDKAKILDLICKDGFFVGNLDDEYSKKLILLARKNNLNTTTYSILENKNADISGKIVNETLNTLKGKVEYRGEAESIEIPLAGGFNLSNALASIGIAINSGITLRDATKTLKNSPTPQGRMEFIDEGQPFTVIVDYAHSPDSFEKVLPVIKRNIPDGNRLIFVFGATGSRDIGKRPIMGEIASRYADLSVITDENPYWEKPEDIISHIEEGFKKDNYVTILDRGQAIKWAFKEANEGDVVLIVGKGHENYICVKDKKIPFNDCDKSHSILREMGFGK